MIQFPLRTHTHTHTHTRSIVCISLARVMIHHYYLSLLLVLGLLVDDGYAHGWNDPPKPIACKYHTFTQGGYGSPCKVAGTTCSSLTANWATAQPGCLRDRCFTTSFVLGNASGATLTLTTAAAIGAFLPQGGTPGILTTNYVDPTSTSAGVFAGQLLTAMMNVKFATNLSDITLLRFTSNCPEIITGLQNLSIKDVIYIANQVIAGLSDAYSTDALTKALSLYNEAFEACKNDRTECFTCGVHGSPTNAPTKVYTRTPVSNVSCRYCTFSQDAYGGPCREYHSWYGSSTSTCASLLANCTKAQPGCIREKCVNASFVLGNTTGYTLTLTTAATIQTFLPQGGKPAVFEKSYTDTVTTSAGIFAGQLLTAMMNVRFGANISNTTLLRFSETCTDVTASLRGRTVIEVVYIANQVIANISSVYSPLELSNALALYNGAFSKDSDDDDEREHETRSRSFTCLPNTISPTGQPTGRPTERPTGWPTMDSTTGHPTDLVTRRPIAEQVNQATQQPTRKQNEIEETSVSNTDGPTTSAPTIDGLTIGVLITGAPTTDVLTTSVLVTDMPTTSMPTIDALTIGILATDAPTTGAPTSVAPTTVAPTTDAPTAVEPTTGAPTTVAPTAVAPTTVAPTAVAPTTSTPTTAAPTTSTPTTDAPTTGAPTTGAPTTGAPTTGAPTTGAPTTGAPTTGAPTTGAPTTGAPTTGAPTTGAPTPDYQNRCPRCCGNGILERGEECDEGVENNNMYGSCTKSCTQPRCGDGMIHKCNTSCIECGDSACEQDEDCDDGNLIDGDGCSHSCQFETYFTANIGTGVSVLMDATSIHGANEFDSPIQCKYLECVAPTEKQLKNLAATDLNLIYWIHNYCTCLKI